MPKHTIILTENQVKAILEKRKKTIRNDEGEVVPENCDKCGGSVITAIEGEPIYKCKECGKYFGTVPFPDNLNEAVTGKDSNKSAAIYAYCKDEDGEYCILCAKRAVGDEGGKYNPPMGHLHVKENPKDGAVRECEEESGVKIPKSELKLGSKEDWGTNYYVYLDGTVKDWPVGEGDEENETFNWIPMKDIIDGAKKDLEWAWNTRDFAKQFAPKEKNMDESKKDNKTIMLSEGQLKAVQKKLFTEAFSPKRQVVSLIRDYLDKSFVKSSVDDINDNGYPIKVPVVSMLSANGQAMKQMQVKELLTLLDDKFHNLVKKDDDRKALLKQVIIDWFNGDISKEGLLSKNTVNESVGNLDPEEFGDIFLGYAGELLRELEQKWLSKLGLSVRYDMRYNFDGKDWLAAYEASANGLDGDEIVVAINLDRIYKKMREMDIHSDYSEIEAQARITLAHEIAHGIIDYLIDYYDSDSEVVNKFRESFFNGEIDEESMCEEFGESIFPEATGVNFSRLGKILDAITRKRGA